MLALTSLPPVLWELLRWLMAGMIGGAFFSWCLPHLKAQANVWLRTDPNHGVFLCFSHGIEILVDRICKLDPFGNVTRATGSTPIPLVWVIETEGTRSAIWLIQPDPACPFWVFEVYFGMIPCYRFGLELSGNTAHLRWDVRRPFVPANTGVLVIRSKSFRASAALTTFGRRLRRLPSFRNMRVLDMDESIRVAEHGKSIVLFQPRADRSIYCQRVFSGRDAAHFLQEMREAQARSVMFEHTTARAQQAPTPARNEQPTPPARHSISELAEMLANDFRERSEHERRNAEGLRALANERVQSYIDTRRQAQAAEARERQNGLAGVTQEIRDKLQQVANNELVDRTEYVEGTLYAYTKEVNALDRTTRRVHKIGRLAIGISVFGGDVSIRNLDSPITLASGTTMHAPHVPESMKPCLGTLENDLPPLIALYEFGAVLRLLLKLVQAPNMSDPWGYAVRNWPLAE